MTVFFFHEFEFDTQSGELRHHRRRLRLRPQPAAILEYLLRHPFEVVSRETLRQVVWPTGTFVHFDHGLNSCIKQIRAVLRDQRTSPVYLETLSRRGYRWIAPVTPMEGTTHRPQRPVRILILSPRALCLDDRDRVVGMGLQEEIAARITQLRRNGILVLTPPPGSDADAGSACDDDLAVQLVLESSVRVSRGRFRVTARLLDGRSRAHVWAATFDGQVNRLLEEQAGIAVRIVEATLEHASEDPDCASPVSGTAAAGLM